MYLGLNSKTIFAFVMCIFLIGTVSALTFDNRIKSYDEETKTIIIDDNFGFGGDLVKITLVENTDKCRTSCYAIWNVTIYKDDDDFLSNLRFEYSNGNDIGITHQYQYVSRYQEITVIDYGRDCKVRDSLNRCKRIETGTHKEKIPIWENFNPLKKLSPGNYLIKLIGHKQSWQTVDWVPSFYGKEFRSWKFWASTDPTTVYEFNEPNGATQAIDVLGLHNLTVLSISTFGFVPGKLNNAANFTTDGGAVVVLNTTGGSEFAFGTDDFTIAYWFNATDVTTSTIIFETDNVPSTGWGIISEGGDRHSFVSNNIAQGTTAGIDLNDSAYHRIVWVREGTGASQTKIYIDNDNVVNFTFAGDVSDSSTGLNFSQPNSGVWQIDDLQIFNGFAWSIEDVNTDWNGSLGREADSAAGVSVVLNSPTDASSQIANPLFFNASGTPFTTSLVNATLFFYNGTSGDLIDTETINITGTDLNESRFNKTSLDFDSFSWNVLFCSTNVSSTVCDTASSNFTFSVSPIINQTINFSAITIEGSTENFFLNLTFNSTLYNLESATFTYNGSNGSSVISGTTDNRLVTSTKVIPNVSADVNLSFFWRLQFVDLITPKDVFIQTTLTNQSVLNIGLDTCGVFGNRILNFTVVDEELQTFIINATIETAVNLFDSNRLIVIANLSGNFTNPVDICLNTNLTNTTGYSLDVIARYESAFHANEYFNIVNFTLDVNSTTQNITLFDLNLTDSTEFQLTFTGADFLPVENALVFVDRQYIVENVFKTVELPKTDANGQTVLHLVRNDIIYNIRISKDGTIIGSFENLIAFCDDFAIGDCKIELNAGASTEPLFNYDTELGITFTPPTFNNNTRIIEFSFLTTDGSAKTVLMNVTRSDVFGNRTICEDSLLSSGGTLSCTVPSNIDDATLGINVFVNDEQAIFRIVQLELTDFGVAGYMVFFVMSLSLILMFSSSKTGILLSILMSFAGAIGLGMVTSSLVGLGASGLWLIIIVLIGIWKLNRDRIQ